MGKRSIVFLLKKLPFKKLSHKQYEKPQVYFKKNDSNKYYKFHQPQILLPLMAGYCSRFLNINQNNDEKLIDIAAYLKNSTLLKFYSGNQINFYFIT